MRAALVLALLASGASAQGAVDLRPSATERTVVTTGALVGGVAGAAGTLVLLGRDAEADYGVALTVLAYPVGMALGTVLASEALGLDVRLDEAAVDAALGTVAGAAAGVVVGGTASLVIRALPGDDEYGIAQAVLGGGVGLLTAAVVSARVSARSVRVAPATLTAPTGDQAVGVTLRVGL